MRAITDALHAGAFAFGGDVSSAMREWLYSQDFYELCQQYRWAQDALPRGPGALTAAEAFEALKDEIIKHAESS